jgi:hypothetical protein
MAASRFVSAARAWLEAPFTLPPTRKRLFAFACPSALERWYPYTDEQDGGRSTAEWRHEARDGGLAVFAGHIDTGFDDLVEQADRATPATFTGARMVRSGYCSVRSLEPPPFGPLEDYDGLALNLRSDSRPYVVNVKTNRLMQDTQEIFQALVPPSLPTPPSSPAGVAAAAHLRPRRLAPGEMGAWRVVRIPFDSFRLTWRGFVQPQDVKLDPRRIESIGLAIYAADPAHADIGYASMHGGPFVVELHSIDAYGSALGTAQASGAGGRREGGITQRAQPPAPTPDGEGG